MTTPKPSVPHTFSHSEIRAVVTGLMLTILLGALDQTIVSVALPKMGADLGNVDLLSWVVSGYLIAVAVSTPIYGKLGDLYGRRVMLSWALGVFLVASVGCALATGMTWLVVARILQGLGGGGIISLSQAIIADVVSPRERGRYQGYISAAFAIASVSGPLLGGFLTSYLSWRWVFWINLPLAAAAIIISRHTLARLHTPRVKRPVDYAGAVLMTLTLAPMLIAITRVGQGSPWLDRLNIEMFALTVLALVFFLWRETRATEPVLPLSLFRISTVSLSCCVMFIAFIIIVSLSVLIPLRAQMILGLPADQAALQLVPFSLLIPSGAFIGGQVATRTGRVKPIQLCGTIGVPLALLGLAFVSPSSLSMALACLALTGVCIGMQLPTSTVGVQNAVARRHIGVATAIIAFCRSLGAAVGIAVFMAVLLATLHTTAPEWAAHMSGGEIIKDMVGHTVAITTEPGMQLLTAAQAAFRKVFLLLAAVACLAIILTLMLRNEVLGDAAP